MANFTAEQLLNHPSFKIGWDHFNPYFLNNNTWPPGSPVTPWPKGDNSTLEYRACYAGANSALGNTTGVVAPRTPPKGYIEQHEQLDLFADPS